VDVKWKTYEEVAAYLLNQFAEEFGLERVEGKQAVAGKRSGTDWIIDAKGVRRGGEAFVIIECRRYAKKRQDQEKIGGLAYRIIDTGAQGGIVVSHIGLQAGAIKVADAENVISVQLDKASTPAEFSMRFLNKVFVGMQERAHATSYMTAEVVRTCSACGKQFTVIENETICHSCSQGS
jgi:Restriction endonuclease